jgi:MoxR-like ATPase
VAELRTGDIVFGYANGAVRAVGRVIAAPEEAARPADLSETWGDEGYLARVDFTDIDPLIALQQIPVGWRIGEEAFTSSGGPNQGYLYEVSKLFAQRLVGQFRESFPGFVSLSVATNGPVVLEGNRTWCIYVPRAALQNLEIGLRKGVWGVDSAAKLQDLKEGDNLLFVWDLASDRDPKPAGFPRVPLADFSGSAGRIIRGSISSQPFEDHSEIWSDAVYPFRFAFMTQGDEVSKAFDEASFDTEVRDAIRRSAITQGRPILALSSEPALIPASLDDVERVTFLPREELEEIERMLLDKRQLILYGPPGVGKTYVAEYFGRYFAGNPLNGTPDERLTLVQFHQSYSYEDFVQGIRPETVDSRLEYHVRDGIFKSVCTIAARNPAKRFLVLIDEINRANISRVFGELLLLLEYRNRSIALPYSSTNAQFSIPPNIFIIGTMNTADRSLAQIDYALRRRFFFHRMRPVIGNKAHVLDKWLEAQEVDEEVRTNIVTLFINLNKRLNEELGEDYLIGHSYFMSPDILTPEGRLRIWRSAVMPLLDEYFYDRRDREEALADFTLGRLAPASLRD